MQGATIKIVQFCCTKQHNALGMHEAAVSHSLPFKRAACQNKLCHKRYFKAGGFEQMGHFHGQESWLNTAAPFLWAYANHVCWISSQFQLRIHTATATATPALLTTVRNEIKYLEVSRGSHYTVTIHDISHVATQFFFCSIWNLHTAA